MGLGPKDVAVATPAQLKGWAQELRQGAPRNEPVEGLVRLLLAAAASPADAEVARRKNQQAGAIAQAVELVRAGASPGASGAEDVKGGIVMQGAEDVKGGIVMQEEPKK